LHGQYGYVDSSKITAFVTNAQPNVTLCPAFFEATVSAKNSMGKLTLVAKNSKTTDERLWQSTGTVIVHEMAHIDMVSYPARNKSKDDSVAALPKVR